MNAKSVAELGGVVVLGNDGLPRARAAAGGEPTALRQMKCDFAVEQLGLLAESLVEGARKAAAPTSAPARLQGETFGIGGSGVTEGVGVGADAQLVTERRWR